MFSPRGESTLERTARNRCCERGFCAPLLPWPVRLLRDAKRGVEREGERGGVLLFFSHGMLLACGLGDDRFLAEDVGVLRGAGDAERLLRRCVFDRERERERELECGDGRADLMGVDGSDGFEEVHVLVVWSDDGSGNGGAGDVVDGVDGVDFPCPRMLCRAMTRPAVRGKALRREGESFGEGPPNVELDSYNDCDDLLSPSSRMHSNRFITSLVFSVSRNFF